MSSTKHYQELSGSQTGQIQVSAPVYKATDFFHGSMPRVTLNGVDLDIEDISAAGMTLRVPHEICVHDFNHPQTLKLTQSDRAFFECAVILSGMPKDGMLKVLYDERGVDLSSIARLNAKAILEAERGRPKPAVTYAVPAEYKVFCAEALDYIADRRQFIESHIAPFEDDLSFAESEAMCRDLEETSRESWADIWERGNKLVLPFQGDEKVTSDLKLFTERLVTREMVGGPVWHRCYYKPMGYPGDFRIMNYMYDNRPEGPSFYNRYLHVLGLISGTAIVRRMDYISEALDSLNKREDRENLYHVMSIGSGPAREVQLFLESTYKDGEGYSFTLVDQEKQALDYAISAAYRSLTPSRSNVIVSGMHTSFTDMLRPMSTFRHMPGQDLIYSAGLLDYLNPSLARRLTSKLYEHLKPGGTLLIGNVNNVNSGLYWTMEVILDWTLYFRNRQEMFDMAGGCKGAEVEVDTDETGSVYMLKVTKPA